MNTFPPEIKMSDYLFNVDAHILMNRIDAFRKLNLKKIPEKELREHIMDVLLFSNKSVLNRHLRVMEPNSEFYRIRVLGKEEKCINRVKRISDCWAPPKKFVKRGRLNRAHEPLLYTCLDFETAAEETKLEQDDWFLLIKYRNKSVVRGINISNEDDYSGLSEDEKLKLRIINNFLYEEFTREVGEGKEYLYIVSEIIVKDYFDLPPQEQDAWFYPSIANKPSFNVCFRPEKANGILYIDGAIIAKGFKRDEEVFHLSNAKHLVGINGDKLIFN